MKNLVFILLFALSTTVHAQIDIQKDSLPTLNTKSLKLNNEKLDNYLDLNYTNNEATNSISPFSTLYKSEGLQKYDFEIPPINVYVGPPIEANTFSKNPFINDYAFYGDFSIADNAWLSTTSTRSTYPTLGGISYIAANMNYQPTSWLKVSAGSYGAKYQFMGRDIQNDMGINGSFQFILSDRIRLNGYGQYSAYGKSNGVPGMGGMGLYPQSHYGGNIEIKINEKFGVRGGMVRELNPFNGKWENSYHVIPVFYPK